MGASHGGFSGVPGAGGAGDAGEDDLLAERGGDLELVADPAVVVAVLADEAEDDGGAADLGLEVGADGAVAVLADVGGLGGGDDAAEVAVVDPADDLVAVVDVLVDVADEDGMGHDSDSPGGGLVVPRW